MYYSDKSPHTSKADWFLSGKEFSKEVLRLKLTAGPGLGENQQHSNQGREHKTSQQQTMN